MRAALALALLAACAGDDGPTDGLCNDAPVVTWESFGQDFTRANCQPCHASSAPDRYGAPQSVVFDTKEDVLERAERVLARAAVSPPTMPPRGGLEADDQDKLRIWLECWTEE